MQFNTAMYNITPIL